MAILEFGVIVTAARGTIGGMILSANKSGPYAKIWAKGSNQRSELQTTQRARVASFAQAWQGITAGQRTDWDTYAALAAQDLTNSLGETYSISGFLWFVRINSNRAQAGQAQLDAAPVIAVPTAPTINAAYLKTDAAATESRLEIDLADSTIGDVHVVTSRLYNSEGRISGAFNLANILTAAPDNPPSVEIAYTASAENIFFGPASTLNDGDLDTNFVNSVGTLPLWIQAEASVAYVPTHYLVYPDVIAGVPTSAWKTWTFAYWNGASYTVLDTFTDFTAWLDAFNLFAVSVPATAEAIKWRVTYSVSNGPSFISTAEWQMWGYLSTDDKELRFQDELQARLGTVQLGQKAFFECRVQTSEGRRGPASSTTALAEAT